MSKDEGRHLHGKTARILAYIRKVQAAQGAPPTLREIGLTFGIRSTNGVHYHLDRLERGGWIRRRPGLARGIALAAGAGFAAPSRERSRARLARPGAIPILGRIAAGTPIPSEEVRDGELDAGRLGALAPDFALRVTGDSMRDAGIVEGDLVLVRARPEPRDGEIVVACIGDETTVKRFFRVKGAIELRPENPAFAVIRVTPASPDLRILGIVVGVYREFAASRRAGARRA